MKLEDKEMANVKIMSKTAFVSLMSLSIISCSKEETGTLLSAICGAIIGGYAVRKIGRNLDEADQQKIYNTT